jgi:hypothetical protein
MSIVIPTLTNVTAWEFPEDAEAGKAALLEHWTQPSPVETWLRAYAFTMGELATAIIQAAKVAPQHVYVDKSQYQAETEMQALCKTVAETPNVDLTIGTSPAGAGFIAHTKAFVDRDGNCWEGATNFSESAWHQVNTALQFVSPEWRDLIVAGFNRDVAYAWSSEASLQIMSKEPVLAVV